MNLAVIHPSLSRVTLNKVAINVIILILLVIVLALSTDRFLAIENLRNVLRQIAVVAIVGSAVTMLMISGSLDLSVGGIIALTGTVAALLAVTGMPIVLALAAGVVVGGLVGLVNGVLSVSLGINPVIATLGTMYVSRGVAGLLTDGRPVHGLPDGYTILGGGYMGSVPVPVIALLIVVVVFWVLQQKTLLGKYSVAVGSNSEAARLSGIRVNRIQILLFVLVGLMAGFGGVIISSRLNSGQPTAGMGFEFDVIVACILGGVSLAGGQGSVIGTVLGAAIIGSMNNGLNLLGVGTFWQTIVQGCVLVLAVGLDVFLRSRENRRRKSSAALAKTSFA